MNKKTLVSIGIVLLVVAIIAFIELAKPERAALGTNDENTGITIGKIAPDFELETLDGKKAKLSDYRGKQVILNFWATWCPPCREEMPEFQRIYAGNSEIVVVGVNLQESKDAIQSFTNKLGITFPILLDPNSEVKSVYGVFTQPVTYFIDENGKITDKKFGALTVEEINEKIGSAEMQMVKNDDEIKTLPDRRKYLIHPDELLSGGPGKDGIPSINEPKFVTPKEADQWLKDNDLVLGINLIGDVRAYPYQIMVWHEIVNDNVAGMPVIITYCPLCGTGIAFERSVSGQPVEFGVSGLLYNSDLVMYDRMTDTLWQQATGKAIVGELTGMRLKQVSIDTLTWKEWKSLYPNTKVLSKDTGFIRSYGKDPYKGYDALDSVYFPVKNMDARLHPKEVIFGIEVDGEFKAYKEDDLKDVKKIEDSINSYNIIIERSGEGIVTAMNKDTDEIIVPIRSFWFAWVAFHPNTGLYFK